ncbi:ketopantoate reductase family protein [Microbacterium sp. gxy059]|uniref:ketopantoate reductase family protein n=1 Tax=Microbacterium sp. gxy059 TaxID=2957199 RepID=UPI003D962439
MSAVSRYVVVGAGAVGAAVASALVDAGRDVALVARGSTARAIRENGLRIAHAGRERALDLPLAEDPAEVRLADGDVLVLATKTQDSGAALATWARQPAGDRLAGEAVPVVTLQNGLETERAALRLFDRVVSGTTLIAARHVTPGVVDILNGPKIGQLVLGAAPTAEAAPETAELVATIAADLRAGGWLVHEAADPRRWKAWKAVRSAAFPVDVLTGSDDDRDRLRALVREEAERILAASGIELADASELGWDPALSAVDPAAGFVPGQLSTWQSFARGTSSEADYLNGEIVLRARLLGLDAPASRALQRTLAAAEAAGEGPGARQVADVLAASGLAAARP